MPRGAYDTSTLPSFVTPNHHLACPNSDNVCDLGSQHPEYEICTDLNGLFTAVSYPENPARSSNTPPPRPPPIPYQEAHLQEEEDYYGGLEEAYSQHRLY